MSVEGTNSNVRTNVVHDLRKKYEQSSAQNTTIQTISKTKIPTNPPLPPKGGHPIRSKSVDLASVPLSQILANTSSPPKQQHTSSSNEAPPPPLPSSPLPNSHPTSHAIKSSTPPPVPARPHPVRATTFQNLQTQLSSQEPLKDKVKEGNSPTVTPTSSTTTTPTPTPTITRRSTFSTRDKKETPKKNGSFTNTFRKMVAREKNGPVEISEPHLNSSITQSPVPSRSESPSLDTQKADPMQKVQESKNLYPIFLDEIQQIMKRTIEVIESNDQNNNNASHDSLRSMTSTLQVIAKKGKADLFQLLCMVPNSELSTLYNKQSRLLNEFLSKIRDFITGMNNLLPFLQSEGINLKVNEKIENKAPLIEALLLFIDKTQKLFFLKRLPHFQTDLQSDEQSTKETFEKLDLHFDNVCALVETFIKTFGIFPVTLASSKPIPKIKMYEQIHKEEVQKNPQDLIDSIPRGIFQYNDLCQPLSLCWEKIANLLGDDTLLPVSKNSKLFNKLLKKIKDLADKINRASGLAPKVSPPKNTNNNNLHQ